LSIAPPERKRSLQEQLRLLQSGAKEAITQPEDLRHSSEGDRSGIG